MLRATHYGRTERLENTKRGGVVRSIPRLILREVLLPCENGQSAIEYAKTVIRGV